VRLSTPCGSNPGGTCDTDARNCAAAVPAPTMSIHRECEPSGEHEVAGPQRRTRPPVMVRPPCVQRLGRRLPGRDQRRGHAEHKARSAWGDDGRRRAASDNPAANAGDSGASPSGWRGQQSAARAGPGPARIRSRRLAADSTRLSVSAWRANPGPRVAPRAKRSATLPSRAGSECVNQQQVADGWRTRSAGGPWRPRGAHNEWPFSYRRR